MYLFYLIAFPEQGYIDTLENIWVLFLGAALVYGVIKELTTKRFD